MVRPEDTSAPDVFDDRPPQGVLMVIEVEDVEQQYQKAVEKGLPVKQKPTDQEWGHRILFLTEPNGLTLYLFQEISGPR